VGEILKAGCMLGEHAGGRFRFRAGDPGDGQKHLSDVVVNLKAARCAVN